MSAATRNKVAAPLRVSSSDTAAVGAEVIANDTNAGSTAVLSASKFGGAKPLVGTTSNDPFYFQTNGVSRMGLSAAGGFSVGATYFAIDAGAGNEIIEGALAIGRTTATGVLDAQGVVTFRDAANTVTTTITGNAAAAGGTATNVATIHRGKGSGGFIINDFYTGTTPVSGLGTFAVDMQGQRTTSSHVAAANSSGIFGGAQHLILTGADYSVIVGGSGNSISNGTYHGIYNSQGCAVAAATTGKFNTLIGCFNAPYNSNASYYLMTGYVPLSRWSYAFIQSANDTWANGSAQTHATPLIGGTTDGTTYVALKPGQTSNNAGDTALTIPVNTTMAFSAMIAARAQDAQNLTAAFEVKGLIDNNGTVTAIIGTPPALITLGDETGAVWTARAQAVGSALQIQVRGSAGHTVRWSARLTMVEVGGLNAGVS
jgi:hypothetical protein